MRTWKVSERQKRRVHRRWRRRVWVGCVRRLAAIARLELSRPRKVRVLDIDQILVFRILEIRRRLPLRARKHVHAGTGCLSVGEGGGGATKERSARWSAYIRRVDFSDVCQEVDHLLARRHIHAEVLAKLCVDTELGQVVDRLRRDLGAARPELRQRLPKLVQVEGPRVEELELRGCARELVDAGAPRGPAQREDGLLQLGRWRGGRSAASRDLLLRLRLDQELRTAHDTNDDDVSATTKRRLPRREGWFGLTCRASSRSQKSSTISRPWISLVLRIRCSTRMRAISSFPSFSKAPSSLAMTLFAFCFFAVSCLSRAVAHLRYVFDLKGSKGGDFLGPNSGMPLKLLRRGAPPGCSCVVAWSSEREISDLWI